MAVSDVNRTYKLVGMSGIKGGVVCEIIDGQVGAETLHMMEGTPPETMFDVVTALQRAYRQGREDARSHDG